jgi:signal transduction histidine kinase
MDDLSRLKQIIALNEAILSGESDAALLHLVVTNTMAFTRADGCALLLSGADGFAAVVASVGVDPASASGFRARFDEGIGDRVRGLLGARPEDTVLCAPLLRSSGVAGILAIRRCEPAGKTDDDTQSYLLSALADQGSIILEFARYRRERIEAEAALAIQLALRRQVEELAEADRRKNEFLSMLAHELRNPLVPVLYGVQALRLRLPDDPQIRRIQELVERQVQQMARLLDDLLDVARITSGKIDLRRQIISVKAALERGVLASRPIIDSRHQRLSVDLPREEVWLSADPDRLEQILSNLLTNAAKYTDPGGQLWLSAEVEGETAVLRVRDTGVGISPELLPDVFDLFTQGPRAADRSQGGLGIGLTLVRRLVELHGGSVEAHSAGPGQGSEFVVRMPLSSPPEQPPRETEGSVSLAVAARRRVLVVEDNLDAAEAIETLLRLHGHEVEVVHEGRAALEVAGSRPPDVVLLDLGLPGMDGYELARRLRAELGSRLRLVAMTGYGQEEDRRRSADAGCDHHLVKPVQFADVERLLAMG